jgi:hypothetical protein
LTLLILVGCGDAAFDRAVAALQQGELRQAEAEAQQLAEPHGLFLRGNVAFADCLVAEKQAATAAAEPFAFDVAIALAEKAARLWADAAMSGEDWPEARRNVERALLKEDDLRRRKAQAEQRRRPEPTPKPNPKPKPNPQGSKKVTEEDPNLDPMLRELPPEQVSRILERLSEKEQEKRTMRRTERSKRSGERDW